MTEPIVCSWPMDGVPCAQCGQPARGVAVFPHVRRTVHEDRQLPICTQLNPQPTPERTA